MTVADGKNYQSGHYNLPGIVAFGYSPRRE